MGGALRRLPGALRAWVRASLPIQPMHAIRHCGFFSRAQEWNTAVRAACPHSSDVQDVRACGVVSRARGGCASVALDGHFEGLIVFVRSAHARMKCHPPNGPTSIAHMLRFLVAGGAEEGPAKPSEVKRGPERPREGQKSPESARAELRRSVSESALIWRPKRRPTRRAQPHARP